MKRFSFYWFIFALVCTNSLFAQDESARQPDYSMWQLVLWFGFAIVFFYFILWRPEQKKRKALEEQRKSMKKGDRVNAMGIIGTVSAIKDQTVILKMYDGAKIEVLKGAVTEVTHEEKKS